MRGGCDPAALIATSNPLEYNRARGRRCTAESGALRVQVLEAADPESQSKLETPVRVVVGQVIGKARERGVLVGWQRPELSAGFGEELRAAGTHRLSRREEAGF